MKKIRLPQLKDNRAGSGDFFHKTCRQAEV
jgi:hypothetical protein